MAQPINQTDGAGKKQGVWSKNHENGKPRYRGVFKDNLPTGTFTYYNEQGKVESLIHHLSPGGVANGEFFNSDGLLIAKGKFVNQKKDSVWEYYTNLGTLSATEYYLRGEKNGRCTTYYQTGAIAQESVWLAGKEHGIRKEYFDGGRLKSETEYSDGDADGAHIEYYPGGTVRTKGTYHAGAKSGIWEHYHPDATIYFKEVYEKGRIREFIKVNGLFEELHDHGGFMEQVNYKDGLKDGAFTEYHEFGEWKEVVIPADEVTGWPEDKRMIFDGNKKKLTGNYKAGNLDGELLHYDLEGNVIKKELYSAGELISK